MKRTRLWFLALALSLPGCYDFHTVGPEDPVPRKLPATVAVTVVYQRPASCINITSSCAGPVTFHASWLARGAFITLDQTTAHTWATTVPDVPINFPSSPGAEPHRVYAVDPFLLDSPTGGISADRLTIGGERLTKFDNPGGSREQGLIYIDANGRGRTP